MGHYKTHKIFVGIYSALERSAVLDEEPEKPCLHMLISLLDNLNFRTHKEWIRHVVSKACDYRAYPLRIIINICL